ncbi:aminotransferase class I/II-fold pyridoxal phosphate-dependent enzyme [Tindallia californiensis]|uniref:Aspartate/methionine/tyrosine aminotransferase n=1 Tax=Tindallia californiensis TaxID=159292 RepID=A0A1H3QI15_9FIRM|nr:aminotransferase class I/II-fold pyridoxal phosphate-dependent enzyme [Tindallia californiensis]SDZ12339.1 Aspartate/methionine/tyrosine aminotransferase [Tindallia californiensis]
MQMNDFKLECYFGKYEFTAPYLLTQSDCEAMSTGELLALEPEAQEEFMNQWLGYTETWGDPELRKLIAKLYQNMTDEDVLAFHGAQEAIFGYMNVMLGEGDHMIAMYPNYQSAYEVANSIPNCECSKWYIRDKGTHWEMDFDELEALIKPNTKLIAITSPNNPTGYTFTNDEIKRLCAICKKHDLYLFSDEVYKGLELEGEKRDWMADHYDKCASLGVMSKAYGLAGLRVGWLVSKDHETLEKVVKFKHYMSICNSAPSEFLAKVALKHGEKLLERNRQIIRENIKQVDKFFDRYPQIFEKKAITCGPVAYHKLLLDMPVKDFCQMAVEKKGVLLLPSEIYDMEDQYFRMGYGRKNVPESLAKFEEFLIEEKFV